MKTAIYIEDGIVQLVLTPESDFEKSTLGSFASKPMSLTIKEGSFYYCQGGWNRQGSSDMSLILRMEEEGHTK